MGFFTRLIAGLVAASTLGAGLAGTAGAVDTTGTTGDAKGVVKLASDAAATTVPATADTSGLPDHLVNGDFEYPTADIMGKSDREFWYISQNDNSWWANAKPTGKEKRSPLPAGFDKSKFAWHSTQTGNTHYPTLERADDIQVDYKGDGTNHYSEITAAQAGSTLYQDVATTPGVMYRWSLKHASINSANIDRMNVMIGEPGQETAQEATRTTVNGHGDKTGKVGTEIATKVSNSASDQGNPAGQWETYTGTYIATSTVTRFAFHSIEGGGKTQGEAWDGNLLDDVMFTKAYKLSYDKNASDATGKVPSDETAGTVRQTKARTTGTVRLASDDKNGLPDHLINGDFDYKWPQLVTHMTAKYNFANVDPAHGDIEDGGELKNGQASRKWTHIDGFDASQFGWKSTQTDSYVDGRGGIVEIQRAHANDNMYAEVTASQAGTAIYQDINTQHDTATVYSVSLRYARRVAGVDSKERLQVMVGVPGNEAPVTMTRVKTGANPVNKVGDSSTTMNAPNTNGWLGDWDTYKGKVVIPANQSVTRFTFKSFNSDSPTTGNLVDDIDFQMAYPLAYDKNASDATGSVPSKTTENTVDPAKTNGTGSVRTIADKAHPLHYDKNASDATGQVPSNTTQTASSKPTGKVSDLVQRTTTREDGSVTVKTIDTSTDVVSGCQVYYPAGQRITLATLAKDDDCWDSSMLTRPGHTQLGWNQDRNATAAQPEVTMVEGGMTVYAVWVGNPVLTYDTNKPNTWNGQMPSTPASVSVPYDTAAADGSGWQSGDTSKIRGYRFLGWYAGTQDDAGLYDWNTLLTSNVTVYAHWQRLQANVVYDANGGTGSHADTTGWQYSDVTVPSDTSKSFKRDGYYFKYWNTQKDGKGTTYKDSAQVPLQDKNVTLYAIWAPYHTVITETGGIGLPVLVTGGIVLLVMGIGSTVMLTRRMRGER